jgi:hypothetical protein
MDCDVVGMEKILITSKLRPIKTKLFNIVTMPCFLTPMQYHQNELNKACCIHKQELTLGSFLEFS